MSLRDVSTAIHLHPCCLISSLVHNQHDENNNKNSIKDENNQKFNLQLFFWAMLTPSLRLLVFFSL